MPRASSVVPGSPSWWEERQPLTSRPRRGRPRRSFARIVAAAADLVDEVGVEGFSMRMLAGRLNTSTATLYRHAAGKAELMAYVVDELFAQIAEEHDAAPTGSWRDDAERGALRLHEVLSAHPNAIRLVAGQVPVGPSALAVRERALATLVEGGLPVWLAARAFTTLGHFVIGFAAQQHAPGAPGPVEEADLRAHYRALSPATHGMTIAAAEALTTISPEQELREGLRFILDGIEVSRGKSPASEDGRATGDSRGRGD